MKLSVVVPVYRSEKILGELCRRLVGVLGHTYGPDAYEIILVNDASPDGSWEAAVLAAGSMPGIKAINLRKNVGQHGALLAGMGRARGHVVVLMDDDLQHSPDDIEHLVAALQPKVDIAYASFAVKRHAWWKKWGSAFNDWCAVTLIDKPPGLKLSSFKAMRGEVAREVVRYGGPFPYVDGLVFSITSAATNVVVEHNDRFEGRGNYGFLSSIFLWTKMATNFSVIPLRISSIAGMVLAVIGFLYAVFVLMLRVFDSVGSDVPGWASIIIAVLVIGGIQLMAIGAIGEYLGRAYVHINGKPQYTIKDSIGFSGEAHSDGDSR